MMRLFTVIIGCVVLMPLARAANVNITFNDFLTRQLPAINEIEQEREQIFREFRMEGTRTAIPPNASTNRGRFGKTVWANERLVPEISQYTVERLFHALFVSGLKQVAPAFAGTLHVEITKLRVEDFSIASISQPNTQIKGKIRVQDELGNTIFEDSVWTSLVVGFSAAREYTGDDYAYREGALNTRIGPIAAEFSEKVLETVFPGTDAPGVVIVEL